MTPRHLPRILPNALVAACLFGLAACAPAGNGTAAPATEAPAQAESGTPSNEAPSSQTPAKPAPADDPANQPVETGPAPDDGLSKWNGYGDTTFGMDETAFRNAWGGDLSNYEFEEKATCFHLWPKGQKTSAELAFMFGNTKFVSYSTESVKRTAPGGGKVGMSRSEIDKLYAGRIEETPHKYTDGKYLRITQGKNALVFETDNAGKVTDWRVGVPPFVDYVEGCS